jgi:hypothetical protein
MNKHYLIKHTKHFVETFFFEVMSSYSSFPKKDLFTFIVPKQFEQCFSLTQVLFPTFTFAKTVQ